MTLGKGRAAAITDAEMAALADDLGCHPANLEAIAEVESAGFGWFTDGRIKILFEKHWFYKLTSGTKRSQAVAKGLARKSWVSPSLGGYKDQKRASDRYRLLAAAMEIDREAALQSVSIGRFQIMGFNYKICGFKSAVEMWAAFLDSEANQLRAFGNFLRTKGLRPALASGDFAKVETVYNGGGLKGVYARKMKAASDKLRVGKWKNYKPGSLKVEPIAKPPKPVKDLPIIVEVIDPDDRPPTWTPDEDKPAKPAPTSVGADVTAVGAGATGAVAAVVVAGEGNPWIGAVIFGTVVVGVIAFIIWKKRSRK